MDDKPFKDLLCEIENPFPDYGNNNVNVYIFSRLFVNINIIRLEINEYYDKLLVKYATDENEKSLEITYYSRNNLYKFNCLRNYWFNNLCNLKRLKYFVYVTSFKYDTNLKNLKIPASVEYIYTNILNGEISGMRTRLKEENILYITDINDSYYRSDIYEHCVKKYEINNPYDFIIVTADNYDKIINRMLD